MYLRLAVAFLISFIIPLENNYAQISKICGTNASQFETIRTRLIQNKKYVKEHKDIANSRSAVTYVPIKFHVVGEDDGSGRIDLNKVMDQLCTLNETFLEFDLQFYIYEGLNLVDNTAIFEDSRNSKGNLAMQVARDRNALNIWIVNDANVSGNSIVDTTNTALTLGYYDPTFDWVVVNDNFVKLGGYTLPHELGHYFSLLHPFHGWGDGGAPPYDESYEGKPAPILAPYSGNNSDRILTEYANGSNCEVAGDMICDTPADYLYYTSINHNACQYDRPMLDPRGERLSPDPTLIMGYFLDNCMDRFTPQQVNLMKADLQTNRRRALRANTPPTTNVITVKPTLTDPIDRKVTANYNKVQLMWAATSNATSYIVEVDRVPSFNDNSIRLLTNTNSIVIEDLLEPGRNYFWRVKPYNAGYTCAAASSTERFKTGLSTAVQTISAINNWNLSPNPVSVKGNLYTTVEASTSFEADLKIYSLTGKVVYQITKRFTIGTTQIAIPTELLSAGIYMIQLTNEKGINNKKLIVQ